MNDLDGTGAIEEPIDSASPELTTAETAAPGRERTLACGAPEPAVFPFGPVMAEGLVRNGKLADAGARLADYESAARRLGRTSALVAACRVRGVLEEARDDVDPGRSARMIVPGMTSEPLVQRRPAAVE